ncbi:MAG: hypothetical protein C5B56_07165 [Proteobacteria bacterium]|nr:MAG: hypothetical protein C5B56_07165 [Pseudomonadota bacterium]
MSNLALPSLPLLEYLGANIIQKAADSALGPGVLTFTADAQGLSMGVRLAAGQSIHTEDVAIGTQGISCRLFVSGLSATNPLQARLFDGFLIGLTAFDVRLVNGGFAASHVAGQFQVPFFTDSSGHPKTVDVELGFKADGSLSISLAATESVNPSTADGLVQLQYSIGSGAVTIEIHVASFEVDRMPDGTWRIVISGRLLITTADLQWPSFELRGLGIDSKGHISIDGGWINLPNQTALDFYGFHVALQKLGFGSDASGRWIGFNGDIHLVEGLSLGGSVRGLRINLDTGSVSFDGVGIDFRIPDVLSITGEIDHIHVDANKPDDLSRVGLLPSLFDQIANAPGQPALPKKVDVFAGQVDVVVKAAGGLEIDGRFIVGHFGGVSVFFLALDAELPVGIPIFLDISLYGLQGLVASNLEPHPEPQNTWWQWYKYPTDSSGINLRAKPDYDATAVSKWMAPKSGALVLGGGATIGTSVDDGFTASAAITLVLMLPGPVIALIGMANILSKRIGGANQDANFNAMAVYDGNSQTFDLTIDAHYQIPVVLEIDGTAELHVEPKAPPPDPTWFFALGRPPHDKRLKARTFDLFESDAYFVVSDRGLMTGTWTGYRGSWSFGPLSVSLDAYLATLAAIQWSPLQIAGGIELHGDVHLHAFGVGLGITADALLEGCAPNPFWVHGEFSVELDLPWPLPDVGATVSLSWGGDNGDVPPAPLALGHLDANLSDHTDSADKPASDHYALLGHRIGGPWPDPTVQYDDPARPGILSVSGPSDEAWHTRVSGVDPGKPADLQKIMPDLDPTGLMAGRFAPVVPQDAHFTLNFAHPTHDRAGFNQSTTPPDEIVTVQVPSIVGKDDMSNINPQPPGVQWEYRHSLLQVAIFEYRGGKWQLTCAMPEMAPLGSTRLAGVWMIPPKADPERQKQMQLKVFPYRMLPGEAKSATWGTVAAPRTLGMQFTDQGLQFQLAPGFTPAALGQPPPFIGAPPGLTMGLDGSVGSPQLRILFPVPVQLTSIVSLNFAREGEIQQFIAPDWVGDGTPLVLASAIKDPTTHQWTQTFPKDTPAIRELKTVLNLGVLLLYGIDYRLPDIKMAILPEAPALYAIQTVTRIEAGRVKSGGPAYQDVAHGNPVVEFAYLQTAAGPGTAIVGDPSSSAPRPTPFKPAPYPPLSINCSHAVIPPNNTPSGQQPASAFPLGGALGDLGTYAQWSWPQDGALAAYHGYDVNAEFIETYVNALYTSFSNGSVQGSLHFRCVDRNQRHTLLQPIAIHVPSIPQQSALVAQQFDVPLPAPISPLTERAKLRIAPAALPILSERAKLADDWPDRGSIPGLDAIPSDAMPAVDRLATRAATSAARQIDPAVAADILHLLQEEQDAATARSLWFVPLAPQTRYTLDVVAGPLISSRWAPSGSDGGDLAAVFGASDATGVLTALRAYYAHEDALTPLLRIQFTSSRYASFPDQVANVAAQIANKARIAPIRHYVAATDPTLWLADPAHLDPQRSQKQADYLEAAKKLSTLVSTFDPVADNLRADGTPAPNGAGALVLARQAVAKAWADFSAATVAEYDGLIAALGRADLVSNAAPIPVPDTELSLFTHALERHVVALLFESPEPMPWRRIWRWITVTADSTVSWRPGRQVVLWNSDGTRGLVVIAGRPQGAGRLTIVFQGNIGAEAPCITRHGNEVSDFVDLGKVQLGPPPVPIRLVRDTRTPSRRPTRRPT